MAKLKRDRHIREKLLEQGLNMFITQGYHGTGIKEVVDQVQVPKGSFYNYFESKEQFGAEVIRSYSSWTIAKIADLLREPQDNALTALKQFFEQEMQRHQEMKAGCLIGNLSSELGGSSALCQQAMLDGFNGVKQLFSRTIKRGQVQGVIRDDIPADELADVLLNVYEGALIRMQVEQSVEPIQQLNSFLDSYLMAA